MNKIRIIFMYWFFVIVIIAVVWLCSGCHYMLPCVIYALSQPSQESWEAQVEREKGLPDYNDIEGEDF